MKKRLLLLTAIMLSCFGQTRTPIIIGFTAAIPANSFNTQALNAAATWLAYGFNVSSGLTLNEARIFVSAVTGTPGTNFTADLYSDSSGVPNVSIDGPKTVTASLAGGSAWYEFTGFTTALTAGTQYWIVLKNTAGTPASNFPTIKFTETSTGQIATTVNIKYGWNRRVTSDSGTGWAVGSSSNIGGMRLKFGDGSYDGLPVSTLISTGTTNGTYAAREQGVKFIIPAGNTWNIRCLGFYPVPAGTPTGDIRFRLYSGSTTTPTLTATTSTAALGYVPNGAYMNLCFSSVQAIAGGTTIRVTIAETTQSDSSGNRYDTYVYTIDNTAASKALMPFGAAVFTYTTDGTTFTDTDTAIIPFAVELDQTTPFTSSGGSGGQKAYGTIQ